MADFMRKMIEEMMGQEALDGDTHVAITFDNPKVCRGFLEGMCLHELFVNTKLNRGDCDKIHSQKLRDEYEKAKTEGKDVSVIENDLERQLSAFVSDCDRRIRSAQDRVAQDPSPAKTLQLNQEIEDLEKEIQTFSVEAEKLGEEGEVDKAMEVMAKIDEVKAKKLEKETEMKTMTAHDVSSSQRKRVCEVCGAFLVSSDEDKSIADHFVGKMHVGYQKIRALLTVLQDKMAQARRKAASRRHHHRSPSSEHRYHRRSRRSSPDRSLERPSARRHRSRERSRDRHRYSSRDRYRHRSRSRDYRTRHISSRHSSHHHHHYHHYHRHAHRHRSRSVGSKSRSQSRGRSRDSTHKRSSDRLANDSKQFTKDILLSPSQDEKKDKEEGEL